MSFRQIISYFKRIHAFSLFLIMISLFAFSYKSNYAYALTIDIRSPKPGQVFFADPTGTNDDDVPFYAIVTPTTGWRLTKVTYKLYTGAKEQNAQISFGSAIIDETKKASEIPLGRNVFTIDVTEVRFSLGVIEYNERTASVVYYIKGYEIELLSPLEYYQDIDKGNGQNQLDFTLKIQSSDKIRVYLENKQGTYSFIKEVKTEHYGTDTTNIDISVQLSDIIAVSQYSYDEICYHSLKFKFENYFDYNGKQYSSSISYNYRLIWNRAELSITLYTLYTGETNDVLHPPIEFQYAFQTLNPKEYQYSSTHALSPRTTYYCIFVWDESETKYTYSKNGYNGQYYWWRKDGNGNILTPEEQRRSIKVWDIDTWPDPDDLRFIVYYWIDPNYNPPKFNDYTVSLEMSTNFFGVHFSVSRPKIDWQDYFRIKLSISLFPTRL